MTGENKKIMGGGWLSVRNRIQHAGHLLCPDGVFNDHPAALQHHMDGVDDLVERGCGAAFLLETDQTQVCLAAVLQNSVELGGKLDLLETKDYTQVSNYLMVLRDMTDS